MQLHNSYFYPVDPEKIFNLVNSIAMIAWALLIFTPRWKYTILLIRYALVPLLLAVFYLLTVIISFPVDIGQFNTLSGLVHLFAHPVVMLAGWVHYLVMDMLIGIWMSSDANRYRLKRYLLIPCLLLTLIAGPIGFISYFIIRGRTTGNWVLFGGQQDFQKISEH